MELSEAKDLAVSYGVVFPVNKVEFLKVKNKILSRYHQDKNGNVNDVDNFMKSLEMFQIILNNFDLVNGYSDEGNINVDEVSAVTRTGHKIRDLGKGLGPLQNGAKCETCLGKGYRIEEIPIFSNEAGCGFCDHGFIRSAPCKYCNGTGQYTTKSGFKVVCKACKGSKVHIYTSPRVCPICGGFWFFLHHRIIGTKKEYHVCYHCEGKGEIPIHNPVLQKGALRISKTNKRVNEPVDYKRRIKVLNKLMSSIKPGKALGI